MEYIDDIDNVLPTYAEVFAGRMSSAGDIASPQQLKRSLLDYSMASLKAIDSYLDAISSEGNNEMTVLEYNNTVFWGGTYIGETIKRNTKRKMFWINHKDYFSKENIAREPERKKTMALIPLCLTTLALLSDGSAFCLPMNKIARFLEEGPENNIHYFASGECG